MAYRIQKLKLGGILDQAVAIVRDHFGLLFAILMYAYLPFQIFQAVYSLAILPNVPANPDMDDLKRVMEAQAQHWPLTVGLVVIGLLVVVPLTNSAVIYAVAEKNLGRRVTAGEAIKRSLGKIFPLIWTSILMFLAIMGGFLLLIIPGILFSLWFGLAQHVVVLEEQSGGAALSRSKVLVRPNMGTFFMLGLIIGLIAFLFGTATNLIPQMQVRVFVAVFVNAAITLFSAAVMVIFYFSCRCSVENFDLEHLAASVDSQPVPETAYDGGVER